MTINPKDQLVNAGQKAIFNAGGEGAPFPGVQWQVSTDGGATFANVTGVEANVLVLVFTASAGQSGNEYRAVFTNSFGSATTTAATLTVDSAPVVTTNPVDETVNGGQTATFTAAASGNPAPTVQWQESFDGGSSFDDLDGETSTTLSFTASAVQDGEEYRAVFTNSLGSATTDAATLTVDAAPVVTINPKDQLVNAGQKAIFNAGGEGAPFPGVQWQVSTDGGATFANVTGVEANVLVLVFTASAGQSGNEYRAVFTNSFGSATTTAATLTVTVTAAPVVTTNPANQAVAAGQTATFTAAASGTPAPTVQWQVSTNGGLTPPTSPGATSTTLSYTAGTGESGEEYRAVFTNASGTATTTAATLTVSQARTIASTVGVAWGTVGTATLQTDATDHLRLLPDGRSKTTLALAGDQQDHHHAQSARSR